MKTASITDMKARLSAYIEESKEGPVVVTRNGKPVAALFAVTDEEEVERLMMTQSPRLRAILEAAEKRLQAGEGIPEEVFWKQVEGKREVKRRTGKRGKPT